MSNGEKMSNGELMLVKIWQPGNTIDNKALPHFGGAALRLWLNTNSTIADVKQQLNAKLKKPKLKEPYTLSLFTERIIYNINTFVSDNMILGEIGVPYWEQVRNHKNPVRVLELYVTGAYTIFKKYNPANNPANFTTHVLKNKINF